jgi:hypothetical protein
MMSFGRPTHFLKVELLITMGILVSAMLFSFEPTREFFIESIIEQQYTDLETFKKMSLYVNERHVRARDLKYVVRVLQGLKERNPTFILSEDTDLLMARAYERLGLKRKSTEILSSLLNKGNDVLSKMDAMLELAGIYDQEGQVGRAIRLIETNKNIHPFYKKSELNYLLAHLYNEAGNSRLCGRAVLFTHNLDED